MASNREIYNIEKISHGPYDIWKIYERYEAAMYLVCGSERACLIDTSYGLTDLKKLAGELTKLPVFWSIPMAMSIMCSAITGLAGF